jgi:hypothetical protein
MNRSLASLIEFNLLLCDAWVTLPISSRSALPYFHVADQYYLKSEFKKARIHYRNGLLFKCNMLKMPEILDEIWNSEFVLRLIESCEKSKDFAMAAFYIQCRTPINYENAFRNIDQMSVIPGKITCCILEPGSNIGVFWESHIIEKVVVKLKNMGEEEMLKQIIDRYIWVDSQSLLNKKAAIHSIQSWALSS